MGECRDRLSNVINVDDVVDREVDVHGHWRSPPAGYGTECTVNWTGKSLLGTVPKLKCGDTYPGMFRGDRHDKHPDGHTCSKFKKDFDKSKERRKYLDTREDRLVTRYTVRGGRFKKSKINKNTKRINTKRKHYRNKTKRNKTKRNKRRNKTKRI